ncbi:hypothetical protein CBS101457_002510 [Exobasidium rhododendri]|nr:hypothetical protein CBS101457_002510 [Exobasidium rhododendri]
MSASTSPSSVRPSRTLTRARLRSQDSPVVANGIKTDQKGAEASRSPPPAAAATRSSRRVIKLTSKIRDEEEDEVKEDGAGEGEVDEETLEEEKIKRYERWAEEYYEIVEQLPLELHRTFALMKELEFKMQDRIRATASHAKSYRDARIAQRSAMLLQKAKPAAKVAVPEVVHPEYGTSSDRDAEGEDDDGAFHEVEALLVEESPSAPPNAAPSTSELAREERQVMLRKVADASLEAIRAAEEKVGLAVTAYDWVDRHIRRLDGDLQRSESSLLLGLRAGTEASRGVRDALGISEGDNLYNRREGQTQWGDDSVMSNQSTPLPVTLAKRKKGATKDRTIGEMDSSNLSASLMTDMAIDPNEPKYCYCDQVSSGDMVACDDEDCPREWFHYHCVGLTAPPKGRWYCLFCAPPGYKGSGTFPPNAPCLPPGYGSKRGGADGSNGQKPKRKYTKRNKK